MLWSLFAPSCLSLAAQTVSCAEFQNEHFGHQRNTNALQVQGGVPLRCGTGFKNDQAFDFSVNLSHGFLWQRLCSDFISYQRVSVHMIYERAHLSMKVEIVAGAGVGSEELMKP